MLGVGHGILPSNSQQMMSELNSKADKSRVLVSLAICRGFLRGSAVMTLDRLTDDRLEPWDFRHGPNACRRPGPIVPKSKPKERRFL